MARLTGTGAHAAADLTLPTTTVKPEEHEIQDPGMAAPDAATAGALIPPPPVHYHEDGSVNATNGHGGPGAEAAVAAARPVVLVRYRPGVTGQTARIVHLVPLPTDEQAGAVSALCGALLSLHHIETVTPGQGMPCRLCVVNHVTSTASTETPPSVNPDGANTAGLAAGGVTFQEWGWPVTCHRDQIRLSLHPDVSALTIPIPLCTTVTEILTQRRCAPPVLAHPYTPDHRIVLTGQKYDVTLPWPHQVHRVTGALLLPPTLTPRGPITWIRPPEKNTLRLCREIDLFGAVRTTLNHLPGDPPPDRHPSP